MGCAVPLLRYCGLPGVHQGRVTCVHVYSRTVDGAAVCCAVQVALFFFTTIAGVRAAGVLMPVVSQQNLVSITCACAAHVLPGPWPGLHRNSTTQQLPTAMTHTACACVFMHRVHEGYLLSPDVQGSTQASNCLALPMASWVPEASLVKAWCGCFDAQLTVCMGAELPGSGARVVLHIMGHPTAVWTCTHMWVMRTGLIGLSPGWWSAGPQRCSTGCWGGVYAVQLMNKAMVQMHSASVALLGVAPALFLVMG